MIAETMDSYEKTVKHERIIEDLCNRLKTLELAYKDTDLMVKKELITYKMMKTAVESAGQEYDKRMAQHLQDIKDYVQIEIADFITKEVHNIILNWRLTLDIYISYLEFTFFFKIE